MLVEILFIGTSLLVVKESIELLRTSSGHNVIRFPLKKLAKSNRVNCHGNSANCNAYSAKRHGQQVFRESKKNPKIAK